MEKAMLSSEFYLPGEDDSRRSVFEETGIHSPVVYLRYARRWLHRYSDKVLFLVASVLLSFLFVLGNMDGGSISPASAESSASGASDSYIMRYDLSADDY